MPAEKESTEFRRARLLHLLGPLDVRMRYTIEEASAYLRQSKVTTFEQIRRGELVAFKDGRRTYIHGSAIAEYSRAPETVAA